MAPKLKKISKLQQTKSLRQTKDTEVQDESILKVNLKKNDVVMETEAVEDHLLSSNEDTKKQTSKKMQKRNQKKDKNIVMEPEAVVVNPMLSTNAEIVTNKDTKMEISKKKQKKGSVADKAETKETQLDTELTQSVSNSKRKQKQINGEVKDSAHDEIEKDEQEEEIPIIDKLLPKRAKRGKNVAAESTKKHTEAKEEKTSRNKRVGIEKKQDDDEESNTEKTTKGRKRKFEQKPGEKKELEIKGKNDTEDSDFEENAKKAKVTKTSVTKTVPKKEGIPDVDNLDFSNDSVSKDGKKWNMKITSWNVNGIRAWLGKDGLKYLHCENPDIVCIQETKCSDNKLPTDIKELDGYHCYWLSGDKEGYSGVGLLSKENPIDVQYGIGLEKHDNEGRVITAEYEKFFLVTTYTPNAGRGLVRLDYRQDFDNDFRNYLKALDKKKPVVMCGDLNVAHEEIDLANPKTNKKNAGFTKEERDGFSSLLNEGFVDSFRHLYPDVKGAYTFWTYMMNARAKNVGWRLDYFVISERFLSHLCDSVIRKDAHGSDHCPVTLYLAM